MRPSTVLFLVNRYFAGGFFFNQRYDLTIISFQTSAALGNVVVTVSYLSSGLAESVSHVPIIPVKDQRLTF